MEKIKCKECGSNKLIKQGGFYVCQNCETMYRIDDMEFEMKQETTPNPSDNNLLRSTHYAKLDMQMSGQRKIVRFLGGYGSFLNKAYIRNNVRLFVFVFFPLVCCLIFLGLTIFSILNAKDLLTISFYSLSAIACAYGVYQTNI